MTVDFKLLEEKFAAESLDLIEEAERGILALESNGEPGALDRVFRAVHTIKGNAGLFDLPRLQSLSHAAEDVLNQIRAGDLSLTAETIDLFLTVVDLLRAMVRGQEVGDASYARTLLELKTNLPPESKEKPPPTGKVVATKRIEATRAPLRIRLKASFVRKAADAGEWVFFVAYNALDQGDITRASELAARLSAVNVGWRLLSRGCLWERTPELAAEQENLLPLYFVVACGSGDLRSTLETARIRPMFVKTLHAGRRSAAETHGATARPVDRGKSPASATPTDGPAAHVRIQVQHVDELINMVGEAVVARNELLQRLEKAGIPGLESPAKKLGQLITHLQERIMRTRLQQLAVVFSRLPRIVHDAQRTTAKGVNLVLEGESVELDKNLLDAVLDPLTHIVRNAIDHGIEERAVRVGGGKDPTGTLRVRAFLGGGRVQIQVADDGSGLDTERIRDLAVARGLLLREAALAATDAEIHNLIFLPGFSTAERVTGTSGRGVGMDVVRTNVERVGGSISIESRRGLGMTVTISLPQTLSILTCLLVRISGRRYALPQKDIEEILIVDPSRMRRLNEQPVYDLRGRLIPVIDTPHLLRGSSAEPRESAACLAVVRTDRHRFGLLLNEVLNPEEFVVKELGEFLRNVGVYSGVGIMGDGESVLIVDVSGIARRLALQNTPEEELEGRSEQAATGGAVSEQGALLFRVGEHRFALPLRARPQIRRIRSKDISHFMGMETIDVDGRIVPLVRLEHLFQLGVEPDIAPRALLVDLEGRSFCISCTDVDAVANISADVEQTLSAVPGLEGQALLDGQPTAFLDIGGVLRDFAARNAQRLAALCGKGTEQSS